MFESALLFDKYLLGFFLTLHIHISSTVEKRIKKILTFIRELASTNFKINNKNLRGFHYSFSATTFQVLRSFLCQDVHIR